MKKLAGFLCTLALVACGGANSSVSDSLLGQTAEPEPDASTSNDDGSVRKIVTEVDAGVDGEAPVLNDASNSQDASVDASVDAPVDVADASDAADSADARAPELDHPECECRQKLDVCKEAFPNLNIDCGAKANCVDTPYFTLTIYGNQVGHRDVVGDPRQGCVVLGVDQLCCSK
jgi:hypothetical protein